MSANEELKRTKGKSVEHNSTTLRSGIIIQELAEGKAKGKVASRGRKVCIDLLCKSNVGNWIRTYILWFNSIYLLLGR